MKKPEILKPRRLYEELSPNILEDYVCTVVHAYYKGKRTPLLPRHCKLYKRKPTKNHFLVGLLLLQRWD